MSDDLLGAVPQALRGPVLRRLLSLAWPLLLSNELSHLAYPFVLFWVSRLLGADAVAAVGLWQPASMAILWSFASMSLGASVLVSRSVGADDARGWRIVCAALGLTILAWAVVAPLGLALTAQTADWLADSSPALTESLRALIVPWLLLCLLAFSVVEILVDSAHATGWTRLGLARTILDLIVLAALLPLLIDTAGLGIAGGPIGEGLSALLLGALVARLLYRRRADLRLGRWPGLRAAFDLAIWREVLAIGLPVQATRVGLFLVQLFLVGFVASDGKDAVASYSVAMAIVMFGAMATLAVAQANAIVTGTAVGARRPERARQSTVTAFGVAFVLGTIFAFVLVGFGDRLAAIFLDDAAAIQSAGRALRLLAIAVFGAAVWQICLAAMAALGEARRAGLASLAAESISIVAALLWPTDSALTAACSAFALAASVKAITLALFLHAAFRRRLEAAGGL